LNSSTDKIDGAGKNIENLTMKFFFMAHGNRIQEDLDYSSSSRLADRWSVRYRSLDQIFFSAKICLGRVDPGRMR